MVSRNRNPVFSATLDGLDKVIIEAGTRRDGTAGARCEAALTVLRAIRYSMDNVDQSTPKWKAVDELHRRAVRCAFFCAIHDRGARGEIHGAEYNEELANARAIYRD